MEYVSRNIPPNNHVVVLSRRGSLRTTSHQMVHRDTEMPQPYAYDFVGQPRVETTLGRTMAKLLVWLLIFQPVYVAMGMELEEPASEIAQSVTEESTFVEETMEETAQEAVNDEEVTDIPPASVEDDTPGRGNDSDVDTDVEEGEGDTTDGSETEGEDINGDTGDSDTTGEADTEEDTSGDDESEDGDGTATTTDDGTEQSTTTEETLEEEVTASSTPEDTVVSVHEIEGAYTFNDGDCTLVADGEFYCVAKDIERYTEGDPQVYSEQDIEGDREIFYFDGNETHRITNNSYDDFAPVFEEETLRIVWQAMLNDRLQVMLHELPTNTTRQVTTSRENSSNPHITGDTLVWQEWVGTNWEIQMTDVDNDGGSFDIKQITDNAVHDMFPRAYDDVITWQREKGASWEVIVYDPRTGKETALEKDEGTKYENPRFVLLFDSKQANGDVETIGYDLDTGEMMELGTKAKKVPEEPKTPNDETEDALPREATSTIQIKPVKEDDDTGEPLI